MRTDPVARYESWRLMLTEVWEWDMFDPLDVVVAKVWLSLTAFAVLLAALGIWASVSNPPTPLSYEQAMEAQNKARGRMLQRIQSIRSKKRLTKSEVWTLVEAAAPHWDEREVAAMVEIARRESSFYVLCRDPRSSAHGLWGFLKATYRAYGGKTDDPLEQTRMAVRYVEDRYKNPRLALDFWDERGYY